MPSPLNLVGMVVPVAPPFMSEASAKRIKTADAEPILSRVISGGQTGIDQAGLRAAKRCDVATGGKMPSGFKTELGSQPELATIYGLEAPGGGTYVTRTIDNIVDSNATVVFYAQSSAGTNGTVAYCHTKTWDSNYKDISTRTCDSAVAPFRPIFVVEHAVLCQTENRLPLVDAFVDFIIRHQVKTLNVAGHRGS